MQYAFMAEEVNLEEFVNAQTPKPSAEDIQCKDLPRKGKLPQEILQEFKALQLDKGARVRVLVTYELHSRYLGSPNVKVKSPAEVYVNLSGLDVMEDLISRVSSEMNKSGTFWYTIKALKIDPRYVQNT